MNSAKNLSLAVLTLLALGGAWVAWQQRTELQILRAAAVGDDRDELKRRTAAAEKRAKDLSDQLAGVQEQLAAAQAAAAKSETIKPAEPRPGPEFRSVVSNAANLMNRPEMQRMMAMNQKAALDSNFAKLFKQLNLAPERLEQFKKLMVERQTVGMDVLAAADQQGLDPAQSGREIRKMTADAQSKIDGEIQALLGDSDFATYQNYRATLPQRNLVNQLAQSLSYTSAPLSDTQSEQLVQILAANPPRPVAPAGALGQTQTATRTMVFATGAAAGGGADFHAPVVAGGPISVVAGPQISDAALSASRSILSTPQYEALQQMQQQQAQMRSMMQSPGGLVMPSGGGIIRIETSTTTAPAHPPADAGKRPGGGGG